MVCGKVVCERWCVTKRGRRRRQDEDGTEAGRRRAGTESKTRTPHKDVGKTLKGNPSPLRHSALVFLMSSCIWSFGECFPPHAWVESGLIFFFAYHELQEPEN